jgi:hypothetical protein
MAGMYRLLIREVFLPYGRYILAIDQGGLSTQWLLCTGHQSGRSDCPMAGMYCPSIREAAVQLYQGAAVLL